MTTDDDHSSIADRSVGPGLRTAAQERDDLPSPAVERLLLAVVGVAVVAGVALRFAPRSSLWLDEALTVNISTLPIGEIGDALRRDGHPPLFYWLLHIWTSVGGTSDWWVRALAGVLSVASLPVAYLAGRRIAERSGSGPLGVRRTGLIALALMAIMPYGIRYGAETRMYSLAILLSAIGYLLADDLLGARSSGRRRTVVTVGAALVTTAMLWTHYWSMWLLAAVGLFALWRAVRAAGPAERTGARLLVGALVGGGVLFLPWLPTLLFQSSRTGTPWGEVFGPVEVATVTIQDFSGDALSSYLLMTFVLIAAVTAVAVLNSRQVIVIIGSVQPRVRVELAVLLGAIAIGWASSVISSSTFSSRYGAVVYPLFVFCVAAGVAVLRRPLVSAVALALIVLFSSYVAVSTALEDRTQAGEIGERITQHQRELAGSSDPEPRAVAIACPDQIGVALQRSLDDSEVPIEVVPYPAGGDPRFIDWVDYADRNEAANPDEFFGEFVAEIPAAATIYLVAMPGYQTFTTQCEALIARVAQERPLTKQIAPGETGETMGLWIFGERQ